MKNIYFIAATVILFLAACKKEKADIAENTGSLHFHMHSYAGENEISYDSIYVIDGRAIKFNLAQMYISQIQLIKPDGSTISLNKKILKTLETEDYDLGKVPMGNYSGLRFTVGFNAHDNALDPLVAADSSILNHAEMWLNNQAQPDGYSFLRVSGSIDTSSTLNGNLTPFDYKIGTLTNAVTVDFLNHPMSIEADGVFYCHFHIDYNKIFESIALNNFANLSISNASENSNLIAKKIVQNVTVIFEK